MPLILLKDNCCNAAFADGKPVTAASAVAIAGRCAKALAIGAGLLPTEAKSLVNF